MSVLLKDFDIPASCYNRETRMKCPLLDADCYCSIRCRHFEFHYDDRPDWCPLVDVPPHGRLIDADALFDETEWGCGYSGRDGGILIVRWDDIEDAPTIMNATINNQN